jgi:preprotein translocase subunit YajC
MLSISSSPATLLADPATLLADGSAAGGLGGLLPIILMFAVIYFIVLRPMSKQEKDRKKRVEGLKKGDQVVLQGGILGRISNTDDPKIAVVELADRIRVRVLKSKIEDLQDTVLKDDKDAPKKDDKAEKAEKAEKADKPSEKAEKADKPSDKPKESSEQDKDKDARKGA